jgi:hypothetical protein
MRGPTAGRAGGFQKSSSAGARSKCRNEWSITRDCWRRNPDRDIQGLRTRCIVVAVPTIHLIHIMTTCRRLAIDERLQDRSIVSEENHFCKDPQEMFQSRSASFDELFDVTKSFLDIVGNFDLTCV